MLLKVAVDNGNSEQDLYLGDNFHAQPNVFAKVISMPNLDDTNLDAFIKHIHDNLIVTVEGVSYFVGKYALKSGERCRAIEVGVDNSKMTNDVVYVNTLAHIAGEAVRIAYESGEVNDDMFTVNVDMATALPVSYYSSDNAKFFADKFMDKEHLVTVFAKKRAFAVKIIFDFVKVIPEGVTACHAFLPNKSLIGIDETDAWLKNARILHVAIGEGTTEFPVTRWLIFDPVFIVGTNNGNGYAIDRVLDEFKRIYGLQKFTRQDYSNVLKNQNHKYHDTAMELVTSALMVQAEEILDATKQVIQKANNEIDLVLVYGGRSILMRNSLEKPLQSFCQRAKIKVVYVDAENAVTLEAQGLYAFVNGNLFKRLKKNAKEGGGK